MLDLKTAIGSLLTGLTMAFIIGAVLWGVPLLY